jgi:hypothetical protein
MGRLWLAKAVAVVALASLALGQTGALAAHRHHRRQPAPLAMTLVSSSQARIVRDGTIEVRLRARRDSLVRVFALSRARNGTAIVVTRTRTVRLRARRSRTVRLRVVRAGRLDLAACDPRTLHVEAVVLRGRRHATYSTHRALALDAAACRRAAARIAGAPGGTTGAGPGGTPSNPISYPTQNAGRCDIVDPAVCLQPFPNDYFTVGDSTTATGRRVNLNLLSMPANRAGKPIDPSDINRNDGFSPGSPIVTRVPGMDNARAFAATGAVPINDPGRSYQANQPVVVLNTRTMQRQLIWAEIDSNPASPANVNLIIRPAANLPENTRYIVALRDMRDAAGHLLQPSSGFRVYRDRIITTNPQVEARRGHFESLFRTLAEAGVDRDSLYVAWDFTVASEQSLSERQLAIRNDAFKQVGDTNLADLTVQGRAPTYQITKVTNYTQSQDPLIARQVDGTITVPCYLNLPGCPTGSRFAYPPGSTHGPPTWIPGNTMQARFTCNIPRIAMQHGGGRPSLYGHGLFGSRYEIDQGQLKAMDEEHDFVHCATPWIGMACDDLPPTDQNGVTQLLADLAAGHAPKTPDCDVPTAVLDESDLSNFPTLVDRVEQSFVNFMYLGRLMIHPDGLTKDPAFHNTAGASVLDTRRLYYDGNSQGGIFGGSLIALEPDLTHGVIGVPGMNYALLLQRSTDFGNGAPPQPSTGDLSSLLPDYAYFLYQAYPNELARQLIFSLMQQMWDHSDPNGVAEHMTSSPLPDTPAHTVLMHVAFGDHQVSDWAAGVEARTIGAHIHTPTLDSYRDPLTGGTYFADIPPIPSYPWAGSAIVVWDSGAIRDNCHAGNGAPPFTNTPPVDGCPSSTPASQWGGNDPHEEPRNTVAARDQKSRFLSLDGVVVDVCGGRPCYSRGWNGAR